MVIYSIGTEYQLMFTVIVFHLWWSSLYMITTLFVKKRLEQRYSNGDLVHYDFISIYI